MRKLLALLTKNADNKELIIHSAIALAIRSGGAVAAFAMNIVIARYLGATEAGYFFLAITVVTLVATIGRIGADQTVLRFISVYSEQEDWAKVKGVLFTIIKWTIIPISAFTFLLCLFSKQISIILFHKSQLQWPLFWMSLSMPFFALYNIYSMALQGKKKVLYAVTALKILTPIFFIVLAIVFSIKNGITASVFYIIACLLNLIVAYYWWKKSVPPFRGKGAVDTSVLWKSCKPLWITTIMQQMIIWSGQFIAGIYNSPKELAQLAVARNTTVLIVFVLTAINYVSAPRFATLYSQGKMEQLKRYACNTSRLMTAIAIPVTLAVWFFPGFIMSIFGKGFIGGIWLLRILAIGQFINAITGSVGYVLTMCGHERDMQTIAIISGIVAIVLAFILNPIFGAIGSAISTAVAVALSNLMATWYVKKRLGFNVLNILGF